MSTHPICKNCRKPKATFQCGICQGDICKSCTQFLDEESFAFKKVVSEELKHSTYCTICFNDTVATPLDEYNETMEKAREIIIYTKEQTRLTRLLKRKEEPYFVENCVDEQEAVLKMSFYAVEANFNALIDVAFTSKKIIVGSHKKLIWNGTGVPITIDPKEIRGHMGDE